VYSCIVFSAGSWTIFESAYFDDENYAPCYRMHCEVVNITTDPRNIFLYDWLGNSTYNLMSENSSTSIVISSIGYDERTHLDLK
jgi:hypothetical protein